MRLIVSTAHAIVLLLQKQLSRAIISEPLSHVPREPLDRPLILRVPKEREGHASVR